MWKKIDNLDQGHHKEIKKKIRVRLAKSEWIKRTFFFFLPQTSPIVLDDNPYALLSLYHILVLKHYPPFLRDKLSKC
jgi:hypothetical protein